MCREVSFEAVCLKAPSFQPEERVFPGMEPLRTAMSPSDESPLLKHQPEFSGWSHCYHFPGLTDLPVAAMLVTSQNTRSARSQWCNFTCLCVDSWIWVSHGCAWQQAQESASPPWCEAGVTLRSPPVSGGLPGGWPRALLPELLLRWIRCCCRAGHLSLCNIDILYLYVHVSMSKGAVW